MGNGMNKILPGLYVGNFRDAKDSVQLKENNITHILSIHDNAKPIHKDKKYLCIIASDTPDQELSQFFSQCIDFIHQARIEKGNVLVHCLAGVSRSVTVSAAYVMTVTKLGWKESINAIRGARNCANPNFGFQKQLQQFEAKNLQKEKKRIQETWPQSPYDDTEECKRLLEAFQKFVLFGSPKEKEDGLYPLPTNAYRSANNHKKVGTTAKSNGNRTTTKSNGNSESNFQETQPDDSTENEENRTLRTMENAKELPRNESNACLNISQENEPVSLISTSHNHDHESANDQSHNQDDHETVNDQSHTPEQSSL